MAENPIQIARYPNRRFYSRASSKYVSLQEIEEMVQSGKNVEIRDSQTSEDLTRSVLTRIIMERQPEKMRLFPTDMLHFILRSNDVMSGFLRDYFQHSLTYLDYLHRHRAAAKTMTQPMHWVKAWLDSITPVAPTANGSTAAAASKPNESPAPEEPPVEDAELLAKRIEQLERRLGELEAKEESME